MTCQQSPTSVIQSSLLIYYKFYLLTQWLAHPLAGPPWQVTLPTFYCICPSHSLAGSADCCTQPPACWQLPSDWPPCSAASPGSQCLVVEQFRSVSHFPLADTSKHLILHAPLHHLVLSIHKLFSITLLFITVHSYPHTKSYQLVDFPQTTESIWRAFIIKRTHRQQPGLSCWVLTQAWGGSALLVCLLLRGTASVLCDEAVQLTVLFLQVLNLHLGETGRGKDFTSTSYTFCFLFLRYMKQTKGKTEQNIT